MYWDEAVTARAIVLGFDCDVHKYFVEYSTVFRAKLQDFLTEGVVDLLSDNHRIGALHCNSMESDTYLSGLLFYLSGDDFEALVHADGGRVAQVSQRPHPQGSIPHRGCRQP